VVGGGGGGAFFAETYLPDCGFEDENMAWHGMIWFIDKHRVVRSEGTTRVSVSVPDGRRVRDDSRCEKKYSHTIQSQHRGPVTHRTHVTVTVSTEWIVATVTSR